jgi:hypothetical protein
MMHVEIGGKMLTGRQVREWSEGMESNVNGRGCRVLRFSKDKDRARVLVRWLEEGDKYSLHIAHPQGSRLVRKGGMQWVGRYQIEPDTYPIGYPR